MTTHFRNETFRLKGLLTFDQYVVIMEGNAGLGTFLAILSVIANAIIVRTFIAMGLIDGVIVSFFALALFDLAYSIISVCLPVAVIFYIYELKYAIRYPIEPYGVLVFCASCMIFINVANVLATTFLAVARCMCVFRPLQFKNTFTRKRALYIMVGFAVFSIGIYLPVLVNMGMVYTFDSRSNTSRLALWISPKREFVKEIIWLIIEMILPISTLVITFVCVVIMINSLQAASKFRQSSASVSGNLSNNVEKCKNASVSNSHDSSNTTDKMSRKDVLVVQQVILISVVYIICITPKILISIATMAQPEFSIARIYANFYKACNAFRKQFEAFNAAINLLIYLKYNTKFRSVLRRSIPCFRED